MGASRILSTKKHSGKVSKCTDLLYAFQTPAMVRPLLFPRCSLLIQSWFSQHGGTPGGSMLDAIGRKQINYHCRRFYHSTNGFSTYIQLSLWSGKQAKLNRISHISHWTAETHSAHPEKNNSRSTPCWENRVEQSWVFTYLSVAPSPSTKRPLIS